MKENIMRYFFILWGQKSRLLGLLISILGLFLVGLFLPSSLWAENPTGYIPSFKARVTALWFFEGSATAPPLKERSYDIRFGTSEARFIFWELNLEHPAPGRQVNLAVEAFWYRPDGNLLRKQLLKTTIEPNWTWSYQTYGFGWDEPGHWEVGSYHVDLYVEGNMIASGSFEIYKTENFGLLKDTNKKWLFDEEINKRMFDTSAPTNLISSIKAQVTSLKFFESGYDMTPHEERVYKNRFAKSDTRYIFWELNLEHPAPGRWVNLPLEVFWYRTDTNPITLVKRQVHQTSLQSDWTWSYHNNSYGWDEPGRWEVGSYQIDVFVEGKKVASGTFEIYGAGSSTEKVTGKTTEPESPATYIPSLRATVNSLQFFESGNEVPPYGQRAYEHRFAKSKTRLINWELLLDWEATPSTQKPVTDFTIKSIWYRPDGSVLTRQPKEAHRDPDWTQSYHLLGYGWETPGNWEPGSYRVDLYIEGNKVASGSFEIYEDHSTQTRTEDLVEEAKKAKEKNESKITWFRDLNKALETVFLLDKPLVIMFSGGMNVDGIIYADEMVTLADKAVFLVVDSRAAPGTKNPQAERIEKLFGVQGTYPQVLLARVYFSKGPDTSLKWQEKPGDDPVWFKVVGYSKEQSGQIEKIASWLGKR
jgi:hypothetical protein